MKPEAGQWWFANEAKAGDTAESVAVRIEHILPNGNIVVETYPNKFFVWTNANAWHHEPRCTGWDWVVPEPEPQPAEDPDEWVVQDRVPVRVGIDMISWHGDDPVSYMIPPTKDGASSGKLHGVAHPWNANEKLRVWCRRRDLPKIEQAEQWPKYYKPSQSRKTSLGKYVAYYKCSEAQKGETIHTDGTSFGFTVRAPGVDWTEITEAEAMLLLNKPTEPEPGQQLQKTRVRLWLEGPTKMIMCRDRAPYGDWKEIHHDAEGFYVEETK